MAAFPDVELATPYISQEEYKSQTVLTLQIDDNVAGKSLRAFCQLGDNPSFKYWIEVMSGDEYTVDWTNENVAAAIDAYFVNP